MAVELTCKPVAEEKPAEKPKQAASTPKPSDASIEEWIKDAESAKLLKDYKLAAELYQKAADASSPCGQFHLGSMYELGRGTTKSITNAKYWYEKAEAQNGKCSGGAKVALDRLAKTGTAPEASTPKPSAATIEGWVKKGDEASSRKDYKQAFELFRKAADAGDQCGQHRLGHMYEFGRGLTGRGQALWKDSAIYWYQKAVVQKGPCSAVAKLALDRLTETAAAPEASNSTASRATVGSWVASGNFAYNRQKYKEAVKWYRMAAEQGHAGAQNNLGFIYDQGWGVPRDYKEAVKWYREAADQGYASAQCNLALQIAWGKGTAKDPTSAADWTIKSLQNGEELCMNMTENATVREIQKILKQRGLYTGAIDGNNGPNTQAAMRKLLP